MISKDSIGFYQDFAWFHGVVEDVKDPLERGRVRVRCFGYHTDNKYDIPTNSLPWATPMTPITSASMSGAGVSATGILQGSWVIGFFRDGRSAQDPIIMGTIPSESKLVEDRSKGFVDPDSINPKYAGPDIPPEATSKYEEALAYIAKQEAPLIANQPSVAVRIRPEYPLNQVFKSNSGHTIEYDDTPSKERISILHKSGSFIEIDSVGNIHTYSKENEYHYVKKDYHLVAEGNIFFKSMEGNIEIRTSTAAGNTDINKGDIKIIAKNDVDIDLAGDFTVDAKDVTTFGPIADVIFSDSTTGTNYSYSNRLDTDLKGNIKLTSSFDTTMRVNHGNFTLNVYDNLVTASGGVPASITTVSNPRLGTGYVTLRGHHSGYDRDTSIISAAGIEIDASTFVKIDSANDFIRLY